MSRLNQKRQKELEPARKEFAIAQLKEKGFEITLECDTRIEFIYKGEIIQLFPYSGWHTGKNIKDGRGLLKLIKQL